MSRGAFSTLRGRGGLPACRLATCPAARVVVLGVGFITLASGCGPSREERIDANRELLNRLPKIATASPVKTTHGPIINDADGEPLIERTLGYWTRVRYRVSSDLAKSDVEEPFLRGPLPGWRVQPVPNGICLTDGVGLVFADTTGLEFGATGRFFEVYVAADAAHQAVC